MSFRSFRTAVLMPIITLIALAYAALSEVRHQQAFADVKATHWAYQAVTELQAKGIIKGYPNGYFQGERALTRYEFAVALQRSLAGSAGSIEAELAQERTDRTNETVDLKRQIQKLRDDIVKLQQASGK